MLRLTRFSFAFDDHPILQDLNFSLHGGEYLSIIGPNGAGKSTLLRCLLRLHETGRTQGEILLKGRALARYDQRELARLISYVPQAGGPIPPYSVEELLRLSRYPHKGAAAWRNADQQAVQRALHLTGTETLAARQLTSLSGGERQKAYLAAALAQDTEIVLLDEPASFLDPRHCAEMNRLLHTLNTVHGKTMITVTHDINHPLRMGGQVLALQQGRCISFGPAQDLPHSAILEETFGHGFVWLKHPLTGKPVVLAQE